MLRKAAALMILAAPVALAPAILPTEAAAAPVQLTEAQLDEEAAGRRSHRWGGWRHRSPVTVVSAPQISIVNQIAIAIAIGGGTATATNVSYIYQISGIGGRLR